MGLITIDDQTLKIKRILIKSSINLAYESRLIKNTPNKELFGIKWNDQNLDVFALSRQGSHLAKQFHFKSSKLAKIGFLSGIMSFAILSPNQVIIGTMDHRIVLIQLGRRLKKVLMAKTLHSMSWGWIPGNPRFHNPRSLVYCHRTQTLMILSKCISYGADLSILYIYHFNSEKKSISFKTDYLIKNEHLDEDVLHFLQAPESPDPQESALMYVLGLSGSIQYFNLFCYKTHFSGKNGACGAEMGDAVYEVGDGFDSLALDLSCFNFFGRVGYYIGSNLKVVRFCVKHV